jgi:hypothetical protein
MASVVREVARPSHYDAYVAMDPGHIDLWAVLFGYHDFLEQLLVIEDEIVVSRKPTSVLAAMIRDKERALWGAQAPCLRVSDTAAQTICDLQNDHGITFVTTAKDDKRAALARLRRRIQEQRIVIHPRCVHLRAHLECGVWRPSGVDYAHSDEHGHFDAIDALLYLDRNIDTTHNPFPRLAAGVTAATHYIPPDAPREGQDIAELFGRRRRHG